MVHRIVKRFDADTVADQPQLAFAGIPKCNGKHSSEFLQAIDTPLLEGMKNNLGIRVIRFPVMASESLQLGPMAA
jgi:hypothetical protein